MSLAALSVVTGMRPLNTKKLVLKKFLQVQERATAILKTICSSRAGVVPGVFMRAGTRFYYLQNNPIAVLVRFLVFSQVY